MVIEAIYQNQVSITENKQNLDPLRDRQNSSKKRESSVPRGIDKIVPKKQLSSEFYHLAEQAVKEEINSEVESESKETFWIKMGEQLEIDGVLSEQISTIMQKTIEEKLYEKKFQNLGIPREQYKWHSGHFFRITKEHNWFNPHYSHPTNPPEKKPKPISSYQTENQSWIDVIDDTIEFLRAEKSFLHKNHFVSKIPQNQSRESILLMSKAITHANERFNNKLKIAPSHYSILFRNFLHSMSSHLSVPYYEHVRKKETFTAKQAGKIIRGTIKDLPFQFEPITPDEAEADGFSGEPCPECGNFRTEITMRVQQYKEDGIPKSRGIRQIHCFKEDKDYDAPKARMPAENISESEW